MIKLLKLKTVADSPVTSIALAFSLALQVAVNQKQALWKQI